VNKETMRAKCWRCGKRRQISLGATRVGVLAYHSISGFFEASLPNPICTKCFKSFHEWILRGGGNK